MFEEMLTKRLPAHPSRFGNDILLMSWFATFATRASFPTCLTGCHCRFDPASNCQKPFPVQKISIQSLYYQAHPVRLPNPCNLFDLFSFSQGGKKNIVTTCGWMAPHHFVCCPVRGLAVRQYGLVRVYAFFWHNEKIASCVEREH
jgi:hypothetical protein